MGDTLYLTPASIPGDFVCRRVRIPNDLNFMAAVNAALFELTLSWRWLDNGGSSVADTVEAALSLFNDYLQGGDFCMIGVCFVTARASLPSHSLACNGAEYLRVDYPDLYAVLATEFIVDADHFKVPDLRGRVVIGTGQGEGLTNRAMNDSGGEETHVLTVGELAAHSHDDVGHAHSEITATASIINGGLEAPAASAVPGIGSTGSGASNLSSTGNSNAHNTMQPYLALEWAIWAK